jgi:hypothetical protein
MRSVIGCLLLPVLLAGCGDRLAARTPAAAPVTRSYWDNPGGNRSVWVTPLGDGCIWGADADPDTRDLRAGKPAINTTDAYGVTVYIGKAGDPVFKPEIVDPLPQRDPGFTASVHIPDGAFISRPYPGSDNPLVLYDPVMQPGRVIFFGNVTVDDGASNVIHPGSGIRARVSEWDNAMADDFGEDQETGNWGYNWAPGIITAYDLDPDRNPNFPRIQHMLRYSIGAEYLATNNLPDSDTLRPDSWPQRKQDVQAGIDVYHGHLKAGTTIGIPKDAPMPQGLTPGGKMLWWTLQHYGALFRDQAGGGVHFTVDQTIEHTPLVAGMRRDLPQIARFLSPLRNQHRGGQDFRTDPKNGPGRRLDTGPPPLDTAE